MTAKQQVRICSNATATGTETKERSYLPLEGLRYTGISIEIPLSPLQTLKWGLGRSGSWLQPFHHSVHCMHLSSPGLALPSHQVLSHCSGCDSAFLLYLVRHHGFTVRDLQTEDMVKKKAMTLLCKFGFTGLWFYPNIWEGVGDHIGLFRDYPNQDGALQFMVS